MRAPSGRRCRRDTTTPPAGYTYLSDVVAVNYSAGVITRGRGRVFAEIEMARDARDANDKRVFLIRVERVV